MMEVDELNGSVGLYNTIDSSLRQFKTRRVQETLTCIDLNSNKSFAIRDNNFTPCESSESIFFAEAGSNGAKKGQVVQLVLPGTGRMVFVKKVNDASELFRVLCQGSSSSSSHNAWIGNEDLSIQQLSLDNKKRPAGANGITSSGSNNASKKPPNNKVMKEAPIAKLAVLVGTTATKKPSTNAMGSAAAKARMTALGEDWPEEEELPGFNPASSALANNGGASKDALRMANNSMQRQKKVIIAKKK